MGDGGSPEQRGAPSLAVEIAGIRMQNPVMVASGTFGYGEEFFGLLDLRQLGAIVVKGVGREPWEGNPPPRLVEVSGGLVNAIGLQNPGVEAFIRDHLPFLRRQGVPVIVNIWGRTATEYCAVAERLEGAEGVRAVELNISCPNLREGGLAFGTQARSVYRLVSRVRRVTRLPLIPKLPPNVPDIGSLARAAEEGGADAVSLINTVPAMVIDVETRRPILGNRVGGLSGPAIHPIAVRLVWEAARAVRIPVIGMGGVREARDAVELLIAGAHAVAVGTALFADPRTPLRVAEGIRDYLIRHALSDVRALIGSCIAS